MSRTSMIGRMALVFLASSAAAGAARHRSRRPGHRRPMLVRRRDGGAAGRAAAASAAAADRSSLPAVVKANNAFALDLYHAMRSRPGNHPGLARVPDAGLAMLRAGARGETAAEIDRALHRNRQGHRPRPGRPDPDLNVGGPELAYQVRLADAVWVQEGYPIAGRLPCHAPRCLRPR